jgi:rubredoxin
MALTKSVIINFKGGIVSPGYLKEVLQVAADARMEAVRFGLRQQLIMDIPVSRIEVFEKKCKERDIYFEYKKHARPNVISSYPAADIFVADSWLREGVYKDVFDLFDYVPKLKVNICDSTQQLVPLFTGHINWISSTSPHFWYLYIRLPNKQQAFRWKELIYTNDIASISKQLECFILMGITNEQELFTRLQSTLEYNSKPAEHKLQLTHFSLPYYEGFNKNGNSWWLGIYRRDELFSVAFLMDVCDVCIQTKIGELYTTPWKSLIIKGIDGKHHLLWNKVLGKYRINVRHAANELNWQVETEEGLILKRLMIRHFDKEDVRTYGLSFAVQTKTKSHLFGSVIIRKEERKNPNRLQSHNRYSILYKEDFNPNAAEEILFREHVEKDHLGTYLVSLCKLFYERDNESTSMQSVINNIAPAETTKVKVVYQCKHCYTVYDEVIGDETQNITAGTLFNQLPAYYQCPTCEGDKDAFVAVNEKELQLAF